jgi:hypothetical protein
MIRLNAAAVIGRWGKAALPMTTRPGVASIDNLAKVNGLSAQLLANVLSSLKL